MITISLLSLNVCNITPPTPSHTLRALRHVIICVKPLQVAPSTVISFPTCVVQLAFHSLSSTPAPGDMLMTIPASVTRDLY